MESQYKGYSVQLPQYTPKKIMCSNPSLNHCSVEEMVNTPDECGGCVMVWEGDLWMWLDDLAMFCKMAGNDPEKCTVEHLKEQIEEEAY